MDAYDSVMPAVICRPDVTAEKKERFGGVESTLYIMWQDYLDGSFHAGISTTKEGAMSAMLGRKKGTGISARVYARLITGEHNHAADLSRYSGKLSRVRGRRWMDALDEVLDEQGECYISRRRYYGFAKKAKAKAPGVHLCR